MPKQAFVLQYCTINNVAPWMIGFFITLCCYSMLFNVAFGFASIPRSKWIIALKKTSFAYPKQIGITVMCLTTNVYIVGKKSGGEDWISQGCQEYEKRLSPVMNINTHFLKTDGELIKAARQAKGAIFAMDEKGKALTSPNFSSLLFDGFEQGGSSVSFIIGGCDGLPDEIKAGHKLISLSKMTWTHQMARLLLLEQIYRAVEIRKGSSYHKE